mmetsp:Transcript_34663/g.77516  ORF Transcript_34663/g.77516 Transcript_34663/m.77516 type:complete len:380 (-) Transcript_34663:6-1145(-)
MTERSPVTTRDVFLAASAAHAHKGSRSVGVVMCCKACPLSRLREWFFCHLCSGVSLFFVRWEDELETKIAEFFRQLQNTGVLVLELTDSAGECGSSALIDRQGECVAWALHQSRQRGLHALYHLDDDELLWPFDKNHTAWDLAKPSRKGQVCVRFENVEAVFEFTERTAATFSRSTTSFRAWDLCSYGNGKSAALLQTGEDVYFCGPHAFCRYDELHPPGGGKDRFLFERFHQAAGGCSACCGRPQYSRLGVVLHFEAPDFSDWAKKFRWQVSGTRLAVDGDQLRVFPYKAESIAVMGACRKQQEDVYRRWRCFPRPSREHRYRRVSGADVLKRILEFRTALRSMVLSERNGRASSVLLPTQGRKSKNSIARVAKQAAK